MAGKLPEELFQKTQIGQILLQGGVVGGKDGAKRIEEIAAEQKAQPAGSRKLLGQMLVDAGLCSPKDIEAALEVQKTVRSEMEKLLEKGGDASKLDVAKSVEEAYKKYEQEHPEYKRPGIEKDATLEVPAAIEKQAQRNPDASSVQMAERSLADSSSDKVEGHRKAEQVEARAK